VRKEPLLTATVWERVQEVLTRRHEKKHRKTTHYLAFSGLVGCGHCGCSMVGEIRKGQFVYDHCTGYRGKRAEPYTAEDQMKERVIPSAILD
jgi:site-specific DNA recombinase